MINTFVTSFQLKNTYKTNSIIYSLKSIPLIKKLLPDALYASHGLKIFANIISILAEICTVFLGKLLYLSIMVYGILILMEKNTTNNFIHIFFFLTITGGLINTHLFNPTKDKYYAMFLLGIDAKEYTLSNYLYFLLKMFIGFLPFTLLFGNLSGLSIVTCLIMPVFVCAVKILAAAGTLKFDTREDKIYNENSPIVWIIITIALIVAYAPVFFRIPINERIFQITSIIIIIAAIPAMFYIWTYKRYREVYRILLKPENFILTTQNKTQVVRNSYQKKIDADTTKTSNRSGYQFFNEIFMRRHSKLLTKSAKKITFILGILLIACCGACIYITEIKTIINQMMLTFLPYFLFIMYLINRGQVITQAMFINCDAAMLTYSFYREPRVILALFTQRLKYIIAVNLMPATVIAAGLPLLLYLSGGTTDPLNYIILSVSILAMSVFFSVHTLVLYYLLQPYNANIEVKNATYSIASSVTYFICYFAVGKRVPTLIFGIGISAFCIIYVIIAMILAYHLAPKTFRLRQ